MIKILFLASNPSDTSPLKLDEESRAIDMALRQATFRDQFEIKVHSAVRAVDLQGLLLRHQPHIVHFCGHGSAANEIVLKDNLNNSVPVSSQSLSKLFALLKDNIRCVVLNACYSEGQAQAIAMHVDCVIGMSEAIGDGPAITFATAFYQAIGYGKDIQAAFELGCLQIDLENMGERDVPRLLSIVADPAKAVLVSNERMNTPNTPTMKEDTDDYNWVPEEPLEKQSEYNTPIATTFNLETNSLNQDKNFSEHIKAQWFQVNKVIESLTNDQYRIIHWLRGHKRAAISGCAGSGKTLIAVEKAIRLDRAGLQTLILCHSPNLAAYIRQLTIGTGVLAYDFSSWVAQLIDKDTDASPVSWHNYFEPLDSELELAFDVLTQSNMRMDAVIIDEAQDFRDTWWLVVQAALTDEASGILYLFYDDNQALLPYRSKYPVTSAPFILSKNCRNAGQVFDFVRKFHPHAPDVSNFLASKGITKISIFDQGEELPVVNEAIQDCLKDLSYDQIVVLTAESGPLDQSILQGYENQKKTSWQWQDTVAEYLSLALRHYKGRGFTSTALPTGMPNLSKEHEPTQADIRAVVNFARRISDAQGNSAKNRIEYKPDVDRNRWFVYNNKLMLRRFLSISTLLAFFQSESWADNIPRPQKFIISDSPDIDCYSELNHIPLHTVGAFKGLESDGVILFARSWHDDLEKYLYVGSSRARYYLHLVINREILPRIPKIKPRVN